ncbi:MAG: hypothetical protein U0166_01320 [Acidobacteriota bacterium]
MKMGTGLALAGLLMTDTALADGVAWRKVNTSTAPTGRLAPMMAYDSARQVVVLFGGFDGGYKGDTWEYSAAGVWSPVAVPAPAARMRGAMAYYPGRGVVLFSGNHATNDTWRYNGTWTQLGPSFCAGGALPVSRESASMAYFGGSYDNLIMFGGYPGFLQETWKLKETNGAWTWCKLQPTTAPAGRSGSAMVWDSTRSRIVIFGGYVSTTPTPVNDTWEWDGATWAPVVPTFSPLARYYHNMAFDTSASKTVLWTGIPPGPEPNDLATWEYSGSAWLLGGPNCSPDCARNPAPAWSEMPYRTEYGMAYDQARGATVLFGGLANCGGSSPYPAETWEYATYATPGVPSLATGLGLRTDQNLPQLRTWGITCNGTPPTCSFTCVPYTNIKAYAPYKWGLNVAAGDIGHNAPPGATPITGPGPGEPFGPQVRGWRWDTGADIPKINYFAYGTFKYGVKVGTGDVECIGLCAEKQEILTAPGPGAVFGPHVRGWRYDPASGTAAIPNLAFFAWGGVYYGATVASSDVDGDGYHEILVGKGPGPTNGAEMKGFDYDSTAVNEIPALNKNPYPLQYYGVNVAGGDIDDNGYDDVITAQGPDPNPAQIELVTAYLSPGLTQTSYTSAFGVNLLEGDYVSSGTFGTSPDLVVAGQVGPAGGYHTARVAALYYKQSTNALTPVGPDFDFEAYGYKQGATVAATRDPYQPAAGGSPSGGHRIVDVLATMRDWVAAIPDSTYVCTYCSNASKGRSYSEYKFRTGRRPKWSR